MIWNHNIAYYDFVKNQVSDCYKILDVGCGKGSLIDHLNNGKHMLTGIDIDKDCINYSNDHYHSDKTRFVQKNFLKIDEKYDAIIFTASIHHMDMEKALIKAKTLLNKNGKLIIVGLSKPSSLFDYLLEIIRILPVKIISYFKQSTNSEELGIPVSYDLPSMDQVRKTIKKIIPDAELNYGLYYRYLLVWINK